MPPIKKITTFSPLKPAMRRIGLALWLVTVVFVLCTSTAPQQQQSRSFFALSLNTSPMSNEMTFAIVTILPDGRKNYRHINPQQFLHIASGTWKDIVNPTRENLFQKHGVFGGLFVDSLSGEKVYACPAFDSLWKIRYNHNPYFFKSLGWANEKFKPSSTQQLYLYEHYGVGNVNTDFFEDTSFWKILRDVTNDEWITNYKSL